jgi:hypothetical protein
MVTAVDTSVLLDVLLNDPQHATASMAALRQAAAEGQLMLGETTLAEIVPVLPATDLPQFLTDWKLAFVPTSQEAAILAGEMFRTYPSRGGGMARYEIIEDDGSYWGEIPGFHGVRARHETLTGCQRFPVLVSRFKECIRTAQQRIRS